MSWFVNSRLCLLLLAGLLASVSCTRQMPLFLQTDRAFSSDSLRKRAIKASEDYRITLGTKLMLQVFANKGELIIDPNFELISEIKQDVYSAPREQEYMVRADGKIRFPLIGAIKVAGKTVYQLEQDLQSHYNAYYHDSYVRVKVTNLRMVVLRGEEGHVVPLTQGHMHVLEVMALSGGFKGVGQASPLLLLRGDLQSPEVYEIDLSRIAHMRASMLMVQPGDVLYVPPVGPTVWRHITDFGPIIGVLTSILSVIVLMRTL